MDLLVAFFGQPLVWVVVVGLLLFGKDALMYFTKRQIGRVKIQMTVLNWARDGHLDSVERDTFDDVVDVANLWNRYLLWYVLLTTWRTKHGQALVTFGKKTEQVMKPIIDHIAPASRDGIIQHARRLPFERLNFWIFVMNDTYNHGRTKMLRIILVRDIDIETLPKKCSHSSRNYSFLVLAKAALAENPGLFTTVEIKVPA